MNAPFSGAHRSMNRDQKILSTNNGLHFVELTELRAGLLPSLYYRIVTTMLLYRNNTPFRYFYRV